MKSSEYADYGINTAVIGTGLSKEVFKHRQRLGWLPVLHVTGSAPGSASFPYLI